MDGRRFDELARTLGHGTSRRIALKGIAGSLFGLALGRVSSAAAQEDPCEGIECDPGFTCADGECVADIPGCETAADCDQGFSCNNGTCVKYCGFPDDACDDASPCCDSFTCSDGTCVPIGCTPAGGPCPYEVASVNAYVPPCCDGLICSADSVCVAPCIGETGDCSGGGECCDGLVCSEGACIPPASICGVLGQPCETPDDCCDGLTCFEALCDNPAGFCMDAGEYCDDAQPCCDGLACIAASCVTPEPEPESTKPGVPLVTTLPGTGDGQKERQGGSSSVDLAVLGGAAALGGALLRRKHTRQAGTPESEA